MEDNERFDGLVDRLVQMQKVMAWSNTDMAKRLDITYAYWTMLQNGTRRPGRKFLVGVIKAFPQLEEEALRFLREFNGEN